MSSPLPHSPDSRRLNGGGVWLLADPTRLSDPTPIRELLTPARPLADRLNAPLAAVLLGAEPSTAAQALAAFALDELHLLAHPSLGAFEENHYAEVFARLVRRETPQIVLAPATAACRALMARAAGLLGTGLTADCTSFAADDDGLLRQTRPALGGNLYAEILCPVARPQMATCRPGSYPPAAAHPRGARMVAPDAAFWDEPVSAFWPDLVRVLRDLPAGEGAANLRGARIVIAGGLGIGSPEGFALLERLAERIGGAVGASRAAVEAGWQPPERQIGQTGLSVSPELYLAIGISGAPQHLAGMQNARQILAINRDPRAPIFRHADAGLCADWRPLLSGLLTELS